MKSYPERLRELTAEQLEELTERQQKTIELMKRDLALIQEAKFYVANQAKGSK